MQDAGLSKSRRAWISTLLVIAIIAAGYACLCHWPVQTTTINPLKRPFFGPERGNTFVHPTIYDTSGMRRAHKLVVLVVGLFALFGGIRWWRSPLFLKGVRLMKEWLARQRRARWAWGRFALVSLFAVILAKEIPSLGKSPDFTIHDAPLMARLNNHISMTLGHADRLAAGDVLFRETTPKYGVLAPVLLAIYERHFGLIALGDHIRLLVGIEIVYWIAAGYLFLIWSRGRWLCCLLPVALLLEFFWSASSALCRPNHSPYRTAGLTMAILCPMVLRRASARTNQWAAGIVAGLSILANVESGIAATVGLIVYLARRYGLDVRERRHAGLFRIAARFATGFLLSLFGFVLVYRLGCGAWPYAPGLREYIVYANLSSAGYGSRPFLPELYQSWYFAIRPFVIVAHATWSVVFTAMQRTGGFRSSFRISVGITLLVWFAYFANRPDPEYMCSYLLLYGLLLVDLGRYLRSRIKPALRRPRMLLGVQVVLGLLVFCESGLVASRVIEWTGYPLKFTVKSGRVSVPLVRRSDVKKPRSPMISKAYMSREYANSVRDRANFLRSKARGSRLVYFTVDSYLMPRVSGVMPLQEFVDPSEALTRPSYDRLLMSLLHAPVDEVYVDARNAADLIWYGGVFDLLRRDLSRRFEREGAEHGWEIWRRRTELAGGPPKALRK
jgi:hypothetical protein